MKSKVETGNERTESGKKLEFKRKAKLILLIINSVSKFAER